LFRGFNGEGFSYKKVPVVPSRKMGTPGQDNHCSSAVKPVTKPYGRIVLTLTNCLLPADKLSPTPSQNDGLDLETETDLRILGCELIQTAGILLKLPQVSYLKLYSRTCICSEGNEYCAIPGFKPRASSV